MSPYTRELFRMAYKWMFGEEPKDGEYDIAYIREVIDGYNRQFEKAFYEYWEERTMKKQEMAEYVSRQYDNSKEDELYKAYGRCSQAKRNAWEHCKALCYEYGGHGLKILGHNCYFFSAGFLFTDEETGVEKVMKITAYGHEAYDYI